MIATNTTGNNGTSHQAEIRMSYMTRGAEKEIAALPKAERLKLVDALRGPIPARVCEPMPSILHRYRVMKFDVDRMRVCYRTFDGKNCVVFAGTHAEMERFIVRYQGTLAGGIISIPGSSLFLENPTDGKAAPDPGPVVCANEPVPAIKPPDEAAGALASALRAFFEAAVVDQKKKAEESIETMGDVLNGDFTKRLEDLSGELAHDREAAGTSRRETDDAVAAIRSELSRAMGDFDDVFDAIEASRVDFDAIKARLARFEGESAEIRRQVAADRAFATEAIDGFRLDMERRLGQEVAALNDRRDSCLRELDGVRTELARDRSRRKLEIREALDSLTASLNDTNALRGDLNHASKVIASLSNRINGLETTILDISRSLAEPPRHSHRLLNTWLSGLVRSLGKPDRNRLASEAVQPSLGRLQGRDGPAPRA